MRIPLLTVALRFDHDLVTARQRARAIGAALGFDAQDQSRIATAVSELARNALRYAGGGRVMFSTVGGTAPQLLEIEVVDQGRGIAQLDQVLNGSYRSTSGMGIGLIGTRRLMDRFSIESSTAGTTVRVAKLLPDRAPLVTPATAQRVVAALMTTQPETPLAEVEEQNRELLRALDEVRKRQDELTRLNRELEDTNRGVVALYAELDEKADHLRRADELKSKFLSNMTHEFRTPVSSIIAISRILLDRLDGPLGPEQEHQVRLIQHAAEDLSELVTDLLDLAKVEAGKTVIRPTEFSVADLFAALRGMLRPLLLNQSVALVFEDASELPLAHTDEGKVSQILRNFISNALKFTERGEVRVSASMLDGNRLALSVSDTGIGIAREHLDTIFEEFTQVDSPVQRKVRGTGLGLPLSRKFATLLGGEVRVESTIGRGSTFTLIVPATFAADEDSDAAPAPIAVEASASGLRLLVIEDGQSDLAVYRSMFAGTEFDVHYATTSREAMQLALRLQPAAIIHDVQLGAEHTWSLLMRMREHPDLRKVPVIVVSAIDDVAKGMALGAADYFVKPISHAALLARIRVASGSRPLSVLAVDDDPAWQASLAHMMGRLHANVTVAATGAVALERLAAGSYEVLTLDMRLPDMSGTELLDRIVSSGRAPQTIALVTGCVLPPPEIEQLARRAVRVIAKDYLADAAGVRAFQALFADARLRAGAPA